MQVVYVGCIRRPHIHVVYVGSVVDFSGCVAKLCYVSKVWRKLCDCDDDRHIMLIIISFPMIIMAFSRVFNEFVDITNILVDLNGVCVFQWF